jgi:hypothetical protein
LLNDVVLLCQVGLQYQLVGSHYVAAPSADLEEADDQLLALRGLALRITPSAAQVKKMVEGFKVRGGGEGFKLA